VRGRRLLVDGSLIDNLPIATMAALGEGPLIAVDVKATFDRPPGRRDEERAARTPGLGETLTRVLLLASSNTSDAAQRHAALTVKPRNEGVGLLEFHQLDRARESGRRAAAEALERAPASLFAG
jgi:NTE family protein